MAGSVKSLKGAVPKPKRALTLAEIDAAIAKGARERRNSALCRSGSAHRRA